MFVLFPQSAPSVAGSASVETVHDDVSSAEDIDRPLPAISEHITRMRSSTHISSRESPCIGMGDLTSAMIANYSSV